MHARLTITEKVLYRDILDPTEGKGSVIIIKLMEKSDPKGILVNLDFTGNSVT